MSPSRRPGNARATMGRAAVRAGRWNKVVGGNRRRALRGPGAPAGGRERGAKSRTAPMARRRDGDIAPYRYGAGAVRAATGHDRGAWRRDRAMEARQRTTAQTAMRV